MTNEKKLSDTVSERLNANESVSNSSIFTPEIIEAMRFLDLYGMGKPKDYILPLNAMAGFRVEY